MPGRARRLLSGRFRTKVPATASATNEVARVAFWATEPPDVAGLLGGLQREPVVLLLDPVAERLAHGRLAGAGPFDLVVDESGTAAGAAARFRVSFLHLRRGGSYRVGEPAASAVRELVLALQGGAGTGSRRSDAALAAAVGRVSAGERVTEVTRVGRTVAKLREAEMNAALQADPLRGRIIDSVPGVSFESACVLRMSRPRKKDLACASYQAPDLYLREYRDVVCRPKSVVVQRGLLTPDTFRHHQGRKLTHMQLRDAGPRFAVAPAPGEVERIEGTYYHLDNEHRGFFGHALTEQVSRLWGWRHARQEFPDARVLVSVNRGRGMAGWEWALLEAAGIGGADVVVADGPVRVERLLAATPMYSMPHYVHPAILDIWDEIGEALRASALARDHPARIFCSRRHDKRACLNRLEVEDLFRGYGFEIIFPEEHPLGDQVAMFHHAEVVAGFAGSGMFTAMFSDRLRQVVVVSSDTYGPTNEYLIAAVRGHKLDMAVGTTAAVLPEGVRPDKPLSWPFVVDMEVEGAWLRSVLDDRSHV